jgi:prefoldin subunit 5
MGWDWDIIGGIQALKKQNDSLRARLDTLEALVKELANAKS